MKTVQMTIDNDLLEDVDAAVQELGTSRSAFVRAALKLALQQHENSKREAQHAAGYAAHPVQPGEFDGWEEEQVWGGQ
jgi:metal-responsive CopG/Arc/MetJ family transcriptional regulator